MRGSLLYAAVAAAAAWVPSVHRPVMMVRGHHASQCIIMAEGLEEVAEQASRCAMHHTCTHLYLCPCMGSHPRP